MADASLSIPNFGQATKSFVEAGIPRRALLPIAPVDAKISNTGDLEEKVLGKAPGRWNARAKDWRGLGGSYLTQGVKDQKDQDAFQSWPTPNVGILGRFAPGIDSDAETEDARRLVERALIETFGRDAAVAERVRGTGPRRLYAFLAAAPGDQERVVRTRHLVYRMRGDAEHDKKHKLDVIGFGAQYLIAGEHQSGDHYKWLSEFDLKQLIQEKQLVEIENNDIARFIENFLRELEDDGGELIVSTGGRAPGEERDYSQEDPIFSVNDILNGLDKIPNNEDSFSTRDEFVSILSAIRAALGAEAEANRGHVEAWATENPEWCSAEYFDKVWNSLDRGVRIDRFALDRVFKRRGVFVSARAEFTGDARATTKDVREGKSEKRLAEDKALSNVAHEYIFGRANTLTGASTVRMRHGWNPAVEWNALDWWQFKSDQREVGLIEALQESERYSSSEKGFWNFIRDLSGAYPGAFYTGETRHPNFRRGEIVTEPLPDGSLLREVNMRFRSPVINFAEKDAANPKQARKDLKIVLGFVDDIFGQLADYQLDTLAYMVQSGKRPGHLLFLVGDPGVGKSIYAHILISMFDGIGKDMGGQIDGTKLTNEQARRFVLAKVEGNRIISIKELPEGSTATNMAAITSSLKQLVDAGPDGDYFQIERKKQDTVSVQNFAYIVITSNYANSLQIEKNDRRIFFVRCGINLDNQPSEEYYDRLLEITTNPERLATFWRYLRDRDISQYQVAKAPPMSADKREAIVYGMTNPWERHLFAALEVLRSAKRELFDVQELSEIMSAMSENEFKNSNEQIDDRRRYEIRGDSASMNALKLLRRQADKIVSPKSNATRAPTIYTLRRSRDRTNELIEIPPFELVERVERDRELHPLSRNHVFTVFAGPLTPGRDRR